MAKKGDDKMDQLLNLVWWLVNEMKEMKWDIEKLKWEQNEWEVVELKDEENQEDIHFEQKEAPYKVIPIEKIVRDESFIDPSLQGEKKIFMGRWQTFKNKKDAIAYYERVTKNNPGIQYDIFPV